MFTANVKPRKQSSAAAPKFPRFSSRFGSGPTHKVKVRTEHIFSPYLKNAGFQLYLPRFNLRESAGAQGIRMET